MLTMWTITTDCRHVWWDITGHAAMLTPRLLRCCCCGLEMWVPSQGVLLVPPRPPAVGVRPVEVKVNDG